MLRAGWALVVVLGALTTQGCSGSVDLAPAQGGGPGGLACAPVDDANLCTEDSCANGVPVHTTLGDGAPCSDGDACTQSDVCQSGACVGGPLRVCDDGATWVAGLCPCPRTLGFPGAPMSPVGLAFSVALADFDGDGLPDIASPDENSDTVSVLRGLGHGQFASAVHCPTAGTPHSVLAADLDGDGALDLAVTSFASAVSVLVNQGDGSFGAKVDYPTHVKPTGIAAGDLDGDGSLDLAVTGFVAGVVSVLLGKGDGTLAPRIDYPAGAARVEAPRWSRRLVGGDPQRHELRAISRELPEPREAAPSRHAHAPPHEGALARSATAVRRDNTPRRSSWTSEQRLHRQQPV